MIRAFWFLSAGLLIAALLLGSTSLGYTGLADEEHNRLTAEEIAEGWILLFDGESTFGWNIDGHAKVEDGNLVIGGEANTLARPSTIFGEYELRLEYRIVRDSPNDEFRPSLTFSGVGSRPRQHDRWTSVSVSFHISESSVSKFESAVTVQRSIRIVRDVIEADDHDAVRVAAPSGTAVALRNVKLRPLGLESIFNGENLDGWRIVTSESRELPSKFTVEDGVLRVTDGPGDIQSEGQWSDFVLQMDIISNGQHLNSGVFFRGAPGEFWSGYESQIRNQWEGDDRTRPVDFGTGGIYNRQPARKVVANDHEWFTKTIVARGPHIAVWVNGIQVSDFTDERPPDPSARRGLRLEAGPISLQGHDPTTDLGFRNIRIAEFPPTQGD